MRCVATLLLAAGAAAWASAQAPGRGLSAAEQRDLLRANEFLLGRLLDRGLELSDAGSAVERADRCQAAAQALSNALRGELGSAPSADRVAELADHLGDVVRDGLAPALAAAAAENPTPASPGYAPRVAVQTRAAADLRSAAGQIPADGPFADARQRRPEAERAVAPPKSK